MLSSIAVASLLAASLAMQAPPPPAAPAPSGAAATPAQLNVWPQQILANGKQYTIFQPVVTGIDGSRAYLVTQVAMDSADGKRVTAKALLQADMFPADIPGEVEINGFRVRQLMVDNKPAAQADSQALGQALFVVAMTIDRASLVQNMRLMNARGSSTPGLRMDPPAILVKSAPAVLVEIAGEPALMPLGNTGWSYVRNSPFVLLQSKDGLWWTSVNGAWMTSKSLTGDFAAGDQQPSADVVKAIGSLGMGAPDISATPRRIARPTAARAPVAVVATKPTVLVSVDGAPKLAKVGEGVWAVSNSNATLLSADEGKSFYLLASGRWFTTTNLTGGAWKYVAPIDAPRAFTHLPRTKRWDAARAALPGTPESNEAALAVREIRTVTVTRAGANCGVAWSGTPQFKAIAGSEAQYAVNATRPVVRLGKSFFCCDDGVWFTADAAAGPWTVADKLPPAIFTIPASCPIYPATYVEIFGATPDSVTFGFGAGYFGSYLNDGTPVYGTGFDYGTTGTGANFWAYPQTYGMDPQYDAQTGTFTPPDDPTDDYAYFGSPDINPLNTANGAWGGWGWCSGWNTAWATGWNNWWGWDHWGWWMAHWHPYFARWLPAHHDWQKQTAKDAQSRAAQRGTPMAQRTWPAPRGEMAKAGSVTIQNAAAPTGGGAAPKADPAMQAAAENQAALAKQFQGTAGDTPVAFRGPNDEYAGYSRDAYRPWTGTGTPLGGNWGYAPLAAPNGFHPPQQFATPGAYWGSGIAAGNNVGPNAGPYSTPQGHGGWGTYDHWAGEGLANTQFTGYSNVGSP